MNRLTFALDKIKPSVDKPWLFLCAGLVWFGAGLLLIRFAAGWIAAAPALTMIILAAAGLVLAWVIFQFGFSPLARKNIGRIERMAREKVCLFAFQGWTSYPLVLFMIAWGIYLRVYSPFPRWLLAILYLGIGGGLSSASLTYLAKFWRQRKAATVAG